MAGRVDFSFYLITDRHQVCEGTLPEVCQAALRAGVRAIQLREKDLPTRPLLSLARELAQLASRVQKAQSDFAAGRLSDRDLIIILVAVAVLILIIVAVR